MTHHRCGKGFNWKGISVLAYKEEGSHFKAISRRILFEGSKRIKAQLRYFEIAPAGYSTLERHEHIHVVIIQRGAGRALVGSEILSLRPFDIVEIAPNVWHQFQASNRGPFGFLCLVNSVRDRPHRPDASELARLRENPGIAGFIKV